MEKTGNSYTKTRFMRLAQKHFRLRAALHAGLAAGVALLPGALGVRADVIDLPVKLTHAKGDVTDGTGRLLKEGDRLKTGDTVRTGANSWASLIWVAEGTPKGKALTHSLVRVEPSSELTITKLIEVQNEPGDNMEPYRVGKMDLKSGSIFANIKKNHASKFEFKTPNSVAGIRGTAFRLSASGTILVLEGEVLNKIILPNGKTIRLTTVQGQKLKLTNKMLTELGNGNLTEEDLRVLAPASMDELNSVIKKVTEAGHTVTDVQQDFPRVFTPEEALAVKRKGLRPPQGSPPSPSPGSPPSPSPGSPPSPPSPPSPSR